MTARRRFVFRSTLLLAAAALLAAAPAAFARGWRSHGPVEVTLVDRDRGYELPQYPHRGQWWVPGTPGHRYSVRLTNHSPERVLVVLSVDGVNALSGRTADPGQGGYVLDPWQTTEVAGWRKSMHDVAQFYFSDFRDSYAARTGRPYNVGVIGAAVFREAYFHRPRPIRGYGERPMAEAAPSPAEPADGPEMAGSRAQSIGTGHGYREYSPVRRTGFMRASRHPVQVIELRYDEEYNLVSRGIIPRRGYYGRGRHEPRAFPGGFVPDPRW